MRNVWIYQLYRTTFIIYNVTAVYIFSAQICEWLSLIFIIRVQKDSKIEEIMFQVCNNYKGIEKKEKVMKFVFSIYFGGQFCFSFFMLISYWICYHAYRDALEQENVKWYFNIINYVILNLIFLVMLTHIKKYGNYVYQRTKKKLIIFFFLVVFSYAYVIIAADIHFSKAIKYAWFYLLSSGLILLNTQVLFIAIAVLYYKGQEDLIMELSKLDYLFIVSIF